MRKTLTTVTLLLALCCTTFAGEMHTPPIAPEPDSTQAQGADSSTVTTDSLIQTLLDVIVSVLP
jgi:hypothetical protein